MIQDTSNGIIKSSAKKEGAGGSEEATPRVTLTSVTAKWTSSEEEASDTLKELSLDVGDKQLVAVIGSVGSGKVRERGGD